MSLVHVKNSIRKGSDQNLFITDPLIYEVSLFRGPIEIIIIIITMILQLNNFLSGSSSRTILRSLKYQTHSNDTLLLKHYYNMMTLFEKVFPHIKLKKPVKNISSLRTN